MRLLRPEGSDRLRLGVSILHSVKQLGTESADDGVGRVLQLLKELKIGEGYLWKGARLSLSPCTSLHIPNPCRPRPW